MERTPPSFKRRPDRVSYFRPLIFHFFLLFTFSSRSPSIHLLYSGPLMTTQYALSFLFILSSFLVYLAQARSFQKGQPIPLLYTKIFSQQTQLPYTYASLPFICPPYTQESWHDRSLERTWLTLDQDITGDRPVKSDYKVYHKKQNIPSLWYHLRY